jgi:hypothetical protein
MTDPHPFIPAGGTALVIDWVHELAKPEAGALLWRALADDLRLALVQGWMMNRGYEAVADRDAITERLAAGDSSPEFRDMFQGAVAHWLDVYDDLAGAPALVDITDLVDIDMELVIVTGNEYAGDYEAETQIPVHAFITQLVENRWRIAALGRRLAVPGWPPTETDPVTRPAGFS